MLPPVEFIIPQVSPSNVISLSEPIRKLESKANSTSHAVLVVNPFVEISARSNPSSEYLKGMGAAGGKHRGWGPLIRIAQPYHHIPVSKPVESHAILIVPVINTVIVLCPQV
jgi:hypothetical protein